MSNKIRIFSVILAMLALVNLAGCGLVVINYDKINGVDGSTDVAVDGTDPSVTTDEPEETVEVLQNDHTDEVKKNLASVPSRDYNGAVFKITSPDITSLNPEQEMEFMSETVAERNKLVSEKHSVSIVASKVEYTELYDEVSKAVKAGMYYSDLLMLPQEMVGSFSAGGLLLNMRSMPGLDFEADYFTESSVGAAAGGFDSYAIAGYASIYPYSLPAVFFNKSMTAETGIDPYALVTSGEWTWDKFFEIGLAATDMTDIFSWGTTELGDAVYESAFVSCGLTMIDSGVMTVPSLAFNADDSVAAVDILKRLNSDANSIRYNTESMSYFSAGLGFFQIEKLSAMSALKDSRVSWGVLPMPKAYAAADYVTLAGQDSLMFACPASVTTPDKSATILMSLNAASEGVIKDAYIGYIQYNFLRDNESANMLDYIIDGITYDFSYTFGGMYHAVADGTYNMIRQAALPDSDMGVLINGRKGQLDRVLQGSFGLSN